MSKKDHNHMKVRKRYVLKAINKMINYHINNSDNI